MKKLEKKLIDYGLQKLEKKFKGLYSLEELINRLNENGFRELKILSKQKYEEKSYNDYSIGSYYENDKRIYINKAHFEKETVVHELIHAFYDGSINRKIIFDEKTEVYGVGIEEGLVNIITNSNNINEVGNASIEKYYFQSYAIKQLNRLYEMYSNRKYDNLIIHSLKEPETIIPLIPKMYFDAISRQFPNKNKRVIKEMSLQSAVNLLGVLDETTKLENLNETTSIIYYNCEKINAMLIGLEKSSIFINDFLFKKVFSDVIKEYQTNKFVHIVRGEDFTYESLFTEIVEKINSDVINYFDKCSDEKIKIKKN